MSMNTETYPATVSSNQDPEKRGRLLVTCAGLMGDEEAEVPPWVEPVLQWGWFIIPDVGELVEIEVVVSSDEDEQPGQASIDNPDIKWRGHRHYGNEEGPQPTPIPDDFKTNYGKRRGFATPGGHILMFDDTDGDRSISLTWTNENEERSFLSFDSDGSWVVGTKTGHTMYFNCKANELSIIDQNGNLLSSDSAGIRIVNKDGDSVELKGGNIQVLAASGVTLSCKDATLDAGKVNLGGQPLTEAVIKGVAMVAALVAHTHPTGVGPSGPPIPSDVAAFTAALSAVVFTK